VKLNWETAIYGGNIALVAGISDTKMIGTNTREMYK